ncbi:hypothetical protein BYT27DRAFT_7198944 [Phlegmacium glaucopus]|nr:hypothetical protein BYT27DRAFT_7198944 [Phlegmacium glaucopus]
MASGSDNHASSSSSHPQRQKPSASRLMLSVKRSLAQSVPKKRPSEYSKSAMRSTFEETNATYPPQQFREADPASSRPTIEQIAMGLHTSRTPHLRPLVSSSYTFPQRHSAPHSSNPYEHHRHKTTSIPPPQPMRSSMKKPSASVTSSSGSPAISPPFSVASVTSTTLTSLTPSSTHPPRPFAGLKSRMARFLPNTRSASLPTSLLSSSLSSPRSSSADSPQPKKAVRFTTEEVVDRD